MAPVIHVGKFPTPEERLLLLLQAAAGNVVSPALQELSLQVCAPTLLALTSSPPAVSGCSTPETTQSVSTAQAASGWARPLSRHFKIQSCCCLGSPFEVAAFQTPQVSNLSTLYLCSDKVVTECWMG
jgi:hypothetical protein